MSHAEICPVCKGKGKSGKGKCHGCNGRGWVTVGIDYPVPYYPPHTTYPWFGGKQYLIVSSGGTGYQPRLPHVLPTPPGNNLRPQWEPPEYGPPTLGT